MKPFNYRCRLGDGEVKRKLVELDTEASKHFFASVLLSERRMFVTPVRMGLVSKSQSSHNLKTVDISSKLEWCLIDLFCFNIHVINLVYRS